MSKKRHSREETKKKTSFNVDLKPDAYHCLQIMKAEINATGEMKFTEEELASYIIADYACEHFSHLVQYR